MNSKSVIGFKESSVWTVFTTAAAVAVLVLFGSVRFCSAAAGVKSRLAVVYTKGIKPYENLRDGVVRRLSNRHKVETFEISRKSDSKELKKQLEKFGPDYIFSVGNLSSSVCNNFNMAPVITAYDTELLDRQDPLCILRYLRPNAKKVLFLVSRDLNDSEKSFLNTLAKGYGFDMEIKTGSKKVDLDALMNNDAIFLSDGALIINTGLSRPAPGSGDCVSVTDTSIERYRRLSEHFSGQIAVIKETGDFKSITLRKRLERSEPAAVICFGATCYEKFKFLQDRSRVCVVLETMPLGNDISRWGNLWGLDMFISPETQIEIFASIVKADVKLGIPYNPEHTELLVLRSLLEQKNGVHLVPIPIVETRNAPKILEKAFEDCDGLWVIPDKTLAAAAIQRFLLEQSLRRNKILIAMMHPYTKGGGMMATSGIGADDSEVIESVVELINERIGFPVRKGKIAPSPVSLSLNIRTIKRLNYAVSKSLLTRAEFVYGKD